ncbi:MAG: hypothetical protein DMF56_18965 [Acidobacteria bacterium]|nr:MAG: hypothetical protein DMF56_18965 [Acidobacteriota bacterium]
MDATLLLKATLLLLLALCAGQLLRRAPAVTRHRCWSVAFAALLLLPLLTLTLPALVLPMPAKWERTASPAVTHVPVVAPDVVVAKTPATPPPSVPMPDRPVPGRIRITLRDALLAAWGIGSAFAIAALLVALWRVRRLSRSAAEWDDPEWRAAADGVASRLGFRRPIRLLVSDAVTAPMAGGIRRATVFLPASCRAWAADQRDVVLAHEISHMASRDPLRHVLTRLAVALYWFHPLTWIAARQAGAAREEACDDAVIALGTLPSAYAQVLLGFAESIPPNPQMIAALPMVRRSLLEKRLMAILGNPRPSAHRLALLPVLAIAVFTVVIAAAQPGTPAAPRIIAAVATAPIATVSVNAAAALAQPQSVDEPQSHDEPQRIEEQQTDDVIVNSGDAEACWGRGITGSFHGSMSTSDSGGRTIIHEQIGTRGSTRIIQKRLGDLRVCMIAEGIDRLTADPPGQWPAKALRFVMEARRGSHVQRLDGDGDQRLTWSVDGREQPVDAAAEQWRDRMLAVFDTIWEISTLRGQVSSLRGEISSIRGNESSLRGEISSARGQVSSLRGRISSIRGEKSSMRGRISSIQGHVSSLRGEISSERGSISSLRAAGYRASEEEIARHEKAIDRLEKEIRDYNEEARVAAVEREIDALDADGKIAKVEAEIRAFDVDGQVAAIERRIEGIDVDGKIAAIERKIDALDADRRVSEMERRLDEQLRRLEAAVDAAR